jgi:hypothetical protein
MSMLSVILSRRSKSNQSPKRKSESKTDSTIVDNHQTDTSEKPKLLTMRFFHRKKGSSSSSRGSISSFTSSSTSTPDTTPTHPHATLPLPPAPVESISVSVWNAAGQDISTLPTRHPNHSSSNLSTTSTLLEIHTPAPVPAPQSPVRQSVDSYGAFISEATEADERRERMKRAWLKAEERRRASLNWPNDPWRGGFGPPSNGVIFGRRDGGASALNPRRVSNSEDGIRGWLGRNGLVR